MVIVLLAEGFEELEALSPVDILRRENIEVKTVGIGGREITGAHGIRVICDLLPSEVERSRLEAVIFPGGMPGSLNLDASPYADEFIEAVSENGGRLAAICAAPLVLGRRGLLKGRRATCFPGFEGELIGASCTGEPVVTDGNITTARDFRAAVAFGDELARLLK
ncbi:MAG: DJ-1/PfpI family protein [Clostridia bacterium]|nr:DJ-1/PfpI family protein [Clostridia bacterium]